MAAVPQPGPVHEPGDQARWTPPRTSLHAPNGIFGLPDDLRERLEHQYEADLCEVRVIEDGLAENLGVRAVARGKTLHFARGIFDPDSDAGEQLIAKEVAQLVQQGAVPKAPASTPGSRSADTAQVKTPAEGGKVPAKAPTKEGSKAPMKEGAKVPDSQQDVPDKGHRGEQGILIFIRQFDSMKSGLEHVISAIDEADTDEEEPFLGRLLEIAIEAAIAGSAEGLAVMAIESVAVHAIEHVGAEVLEKSEALQETIKATFEGSAKALRGKRDGKGVDTKQLKSEFKRISDAQRGDFMGQVADKWLAIAGAMDRLPAPVVDSFVHRLNVMSSDKMNDRMELTYMSAWMNFLARAKHGHAPMTQDKEGKVHGDQSVDPDGIDLWKTDGSFQRPPKLHGVLEINMFEERGFVYLDNVGKDVRNELRRLGRNGTALRIRDLNMNMLVRDGEWGRNTNELVVGPDGTILTPPQPTANQLKMVERARNLAVANIKRDETDEGHDK